jgi:hypothetical protein
MRRSNQRPTWRPGAAWIALVLTACAPAPAAGAPATLGPGGSALTASSSGVCEAILALPDAAAADRAFINVAHQALHRLAADNRLDRPMSARVLETMQRVEADFSGATDSASLGVDLAALREAADAALSAIGEEVPACAL